MKKKISELKAEEIKICKMQFEQLLGELIISQFRAEFLAFKLLSKEDYQEMCKNVADFSKKICINQKKDVTLQPDSEKNEHPTPPQSGVNV